MPLTSTSNVTSIGGLPRVAVGMSLNSKVAALRSDRTSVTGWIMLGTLKPSMAKLSYQTRSPPTTSVVSSTIPDTAMSLRNMKVGRSKNGGKTRLDSVLGYHTELMVASLASNNDFQHLSHGCFARQVPIYFLDKTRLGLDGALK
jgi:hypothetical protein